MPKRFYVVSHRVGSGSKKLEYSLTLGGVGRGYGPLQGGVGGRERERDGCHLPRHQDWGMGKPLKRSVDIRAGRLMTAAVSIASIPRQYYFIADIMASISFRKLK